MGLTAISPLVVLLTWGVSVGALAVLERKAKALEPCAARVGVSFEQPAVTAAINAAANPAVGRRRLMRTPPRQSPASASGKVNADVRRRPISNSSTPTSVVLEPDPAPPRAVQKGRIAHRERDPEGPPDQRDPKPMLAGSGLRRRQRKSRRDRRGQQQGKEAGRRRGQGA